MITAWVLLFGGLLIECAVILLLVAPLNRDRRVAMAKYFHHHRYAGQFKYYFSFIVFAVLLAFVFTTMEVQKYQDRLSRGQAGQIEHLMDKHGLTKAERNSMLAGIVLFNIFVIAGQIMTLSSFAEVLENGKEKPTKKTQ
eukprot:Clim_evm90s157 gene=Clim_evmTU90s157